MVFGNDDLEYDPPAIGVGMLPIMFRSDRDKLVSLTEDVISGLVQVLNALGKV